MIWDCVAASEIGKTSWVDAIMDLMEFQQILEANNRLSLEKNLNLKIAWPLQVDNDPKNTPKSALDYSQRHNLKALR